MKPNALLRAREPVLRRLLAVCVFLSIPLIVTPFLRPTPPEYLPAILTALIGSFVLCTLALWPLRSFFASATVLGVVAAAMLRRRGVDLDSCIGGMGAASLLVTAIAWLRGDAERREALRPTLLAAVLLPVFFVAGVGWTVLTARVVPRVLDPWIYVADLTLRVHSFDVGRFYLKHRALQAVSHVVYDYQWVFLLLLFVRQLFDRRARLDLLTTVVVGTIVGVSLYYVFPVIGPQPLFQAGFPLRPPPISSLRLEPILGIPVPRNCVPSMHNAWALLLFWHARPYERPIRVLSFLAMIVTALATFGFGYHYVLDFVIAWPTALAIQGLTTSGEVARRRAAVGVGFALVFAWLATIRWGLRALVVVPGLTWALVIATLVASWVLEARLFRTAEVFEPEPPAAPVPERTMLPALLFFVSGFTGLCYEVTFSKSLGLTFGNTANALTTVLATYMGGMALGAWIGGRWAERTRAPLRAYGLCELVIALLCLSSPMQLRWLRDVYVHVAVGSEPGRPALVLGRMALEVVVLFPPTVAMGATLPLLFAHLRARGVTGEQAIGRLYGANTLGAAAGALLTGYFLLPALGGSDTLVLAVAINLFIALVALLLGRRAAEVTAERPVVEEQPESDRRLGLVALCVSGFVTLALETVYDHLLAVVIGNSAYAFAVMLFTFLLGLALGATTISRISRRWPGHAVELLALAATVLSVVLLGMNLLWAGIPAYFAGFQGYPYGQTFVEREYVRLLVCVAICVPPTLCLGGIYTVAMTLASSGPSAERRLGSAATLNTVGNIAGAVIMGLFILPRFGSLHAAQLLAVFALALALFSAYRLPQRRALLVVLAVALPFAFGQPTSFDLERLGSGANVYFADRNWGSVIDWAESRDGGLTTVARSREQPPTLTLLTNGKFQGNDTGEVTAQYSIALVPLLHAPRRDRVLVIGYGTGASARAFRAASFGRVDIVELSEDVVRLADRHFAHINGKVSTAEGVHLHITDGRNYLLVDQGRYDVISMEISSIWFRGAASLYDREFYELARARLADGGVLQQWIQLHHMKLPDIVSVIATMQTVFPETRLYERGGQGILIGCTKACPPLDGFYESELDRTGLRALLSKEAPSAADVRGSMLLGAHEVATLRERLGVRGLELESLIANDDNMLLEYSTPKGVEVTTPVTPVLLGLFGKTAKTPAPTP